MIKRKRFINILGVRHKIKHVDTGENGGYYCAVEKTIEIDKTLKDKELYINTVLHEGFHGVFHVTGINQDISLVQEHVITDSIISFLRENFTIELKK
jgi:hypothetical protein